MTNQKASQHLETWYFHKFLFIKIRTIIELTPAPFRFSSVQKFSHRRGAHIKKLILWELIGVPNNIREGVDPFPDPVRHFGPPGGHFRFCCQCGNADCEQMLPMLKGCFAFIPPPFSRGHQLYNEPLFVFLSVQKIPCFSVLPIVCFSVPLFLRFFVAPSPCALFCPPLRRCACFSSL